MLELAAQVTELEREKRVLEEDLAVCVCLCVCLCVCVCARAFCVCACVVCTSCGGVRRAGGGGDVFVGRGRVPTRSRHVDLCSDVLETHTSGVSGYSGLRGRRANKGFLEAAAEATG
jgi:hypothetical protein